MVIIWGWGGEAEIRYSKPTHFKNDCDYEIYPIQLFRDRFSAVHEHSRGV